MSKPLASLGFSAFDSNLSFFKNTEEYLVYVSSTNFVILDIKSGAQHQNIYLGAEKTTSIIFSSDKPHIFRGCQNGSVSLFEIVSGRKIAENKENNTPVACLAISEFNTSIMATADIEGLVRILATNNLKEQRTIGLKSKAVVNIKFSPLKNDIIVGDASGILKLFDCFTGTERWNINTKSEKIVEIYFIAKGLNIALLDEKGDLKIYTTQDGKELKMFNIGEHKIIAAANEFKGDKLIFFAQENGSVKSFDIDSKKTTIFLDTMSDTICSIAISNNEKQIIALGLNRGLLTIIDPASREKKQRTFEPLYRDIKSLNFSEDGSLIVTSASNDDMTIFESLSGRKLRSFSNHSENIYALRFSHGSRVINYVNSECCICSLNSDTGEVLNNIIKNYSITSAKLLPDSSKVLVTGWDKKVKFLETATGKEIKEYEGIPSVMLTSEFDQDCLRFITGGYDKIVRCLGINEGNMIFETIELDNLITSLAYTPDGTKFAAGSQEGQIQLFDAQTGDKFMEVIYAHYGRVSKIVFTLDSKYLISSSFDSTIKINEITQSESEYILLQETKSPITLMELSPNGKIIVTIDKEGGSKIWNLNREKTERFDYAKSADAIQSLAVSPDGDRLLVGHSTGSIFLYDYHSSCVLNVYENLHDGNEVKSLQFSKDGKKGLSAGGRDKRIKLFNTTGSMNIIWTSDTQQGIVNGACFVPGTSEVVAAVGRNIKVFDFDKGLELKKFSYHSGDIESIDLSPDGAKIITGNRSCPVYVFNKATEKELFSISDNLGAAFSVKFSYDGSRILLGCHKTQMRLMDSNTGKEIRMFNGHFGEVKTVSFSPDGKFVLSGGMDALLRVYETETGVLKGVYKGNQGPIFSVAFSQNGKHILAGGKDSVVRIYDIEKDGKKGNFYSLNIKEN